jgi:hypothetical protein
MQTGSTRNQYIVEILPRAVRQHVSYCGFEAPLDPITFDRTAHLPAHREAEPGLF